MVSHHPAKSGCPRHCRTGDVFLVAEEEDSRCSPFNSPLISKGHGLKAHGISY